jgi:glutaredoxin
MKEYKVFLWVGIFMVIVVFGLIWLANQSTQSNEQTNDLDENGITLFYGAECPHCKDVEKYIEENDIKNKVVFNNLEVWQNKDNATLMKKAATACELDLDSIGVPFLFGKGQCYIGAPDVQEFFKEEANI